MCMRGELADTAGLSPFSEWDGVLLVDPQRRITYLSGIANNLYRRLGYLEDLRGKRLSFLNTTDDEMVVAALENRCPLRGRGPGRLAHLGAQGAARLGAARPSPAGCAA